MDFFSILERAAKKDTVEVYVDFHNAPSEDLMVRGKSFYAIWDEKKGLWSQNEYDVRRLVDQEIRDYYEKVKARLPDTTVSAKYMVNNKSNLWLEYRNWISRLPDCYQQLDNKITFADEKVSKTDYVSKRLNYTPHEGPCPAFEEMMSTLYSPLERQKIEWAIGSIFAGDSVKIEKFIVLYGEGGTGKGTVLDIVRRLFTIDPVKETGYYSVFNAKELVQQNNQFSTAAFKNNPLVAIQYDGKLDRIEDNTKLNSLISHEEILVNEKHQPAFKMRAKCMLFIGTNDPVQITDSKSGIIRRLIDVVPTGNLIPAGRYRQLRKQIDFELGEIAWHCMEVYKSLGMDYYGSYRPIKMQQYTDEFFNFVESEYDDFKAKDGVSLSDAYVLYKAYTDDTNCHRLVRHRFANQLKDYFREFYERTTVNGMQVRSWYSGFRTDRFEQKKIEKTPQKMFLKFDSEKSILDEVFSDCLAQEDTGDPVNPLKVSWDKCTTKLKDIDTHKVHWVRPPNQSYIMIDFDLLDAEGNKSPEKNLMAASQFKPTYGEFSRGGGVHLIYIYTGDATMLESHYADHIEIKVYPDDKKLAMRRKLTKCNNLPIATLSSGLPLKEAKDEVVDYKQINDEKHLRALVAKALLKEIKKCESTHQSMLFIEYITNECYKHTEFSYDISDLYDDVYAFANNATNSGQECLKILTRIHFKSKNNEDSEKFSADVAPTELKIGNWNEVPFEQLWFLDIECYNNLFLVCYKLFGDNPCIRCFNPSPQDMLAILSRPYGGYNCRRYDNHMMHARTLGKNEAECFENSQGIIVDKNRNYMYGPAYNYSYIDVYDMCMKKQSLKQWEVELDIPYDEMDIPWDKPAPPELWDRIADYCENDVRATEAVFVANMADYETRLMLVRICHILGMPAIPNDTTNALAIKIITRGVKDPQSHLVYTDLSTIFPGYEYKYSPEHKSFISVYRGEITGEGGYVYAVPGMYSNVVTLDVDSMHPHSAIALRYFGDLTDNFADLVTLRMLIKNGEFEEAKKMFGGALSDLLDDPSKAKTLGQALKIVINSMYGLTAASFDNPLRHPQNKDNIIAKYGALFMVNLRHEIEDRGFNVIHCKTDSIKIVSPTDEILDFAQEYARKYGFHFKVEARYKRICLVNDAVYIAYEAEEGWTATGAQFKHPVVFKRLFSHEDVTFKDYCETKSVSTSIYLDFDEENVEEERVLEASYGRLERDFKKAGKRITSLTDEMKLPENTPETIESIAKDLDILRNSTIPEMETELERLKMQIECCHNRKFVGRVGRFIPVKAGCGGGRLVREANGKYNSVTGASDFRWKEVKVVEKQGWEDQIDMGYYNQLCDSARSAIEKYGPFESFAEI